MMLSRYRSWHSNGGSLSAGGTEFGPCRWFWRKFHSNSRFLHWVLDSYSMFFFFLVLISSYDALHAISHFVCYLPDFSVGDICIYPRPVHAY